MLLRYHGVTFGARLLCFFFFFNDTSTTEIYTLSLHDALPISKLPNLQKKMQKQKVQVKKPSKK